MTTPTVAFATNQTWVLIARVVSPDRPYTHRTPSLISRRRWGASPVSPAACSRVPNVATVIADIRYVAEFTSTARGAPTTPTSTPANAGPDVCATASAPSSRAWARCRCSPGTSRGRNDMEAASLTSDAVPKAATMTSSSGRDSTSTAQATGMAVSSAARVRSVATMSGPAPPPVHERAHEQSEHQVREPARGAEPPDLLGRAVEGEDHQGLQREQRDVVPEARHGLPGPEPPELG